MAALDVITFHRGLEEQFGVDAVWMSEVTRSAGVSMVTPDGDPLDTGFFNDSAKKGLPYPERDSYALTTIPDNATDTDYRLIVAQRAEEADALLREEDAWAYLEGVDDVPRIVFSRRIGQPVLGQLISELAREAVVLDSAGRQAIKEARQGDARLAQLRSVGRALWSAGGLGKLDDTFFMYCQNRAGP